MLILKIKSIGSEELGCPTFLWPCPGLGPSGLTETFLKGSPPLEEESSSNFSGRRSAQICQNSLEHSNSLSYKYPGGLRLSKPI